MRHVEKQGTHGSIPTGEALCGEPLVFGTRTWGDEHGNTGSEPIKHTLTETALASDCDTCRHLVGVAPLNCVPTGSKTPIGVRGVPQWEPQPLPNAEAVLEYVARRRSD